MIIELTHGKIGCIKNNSRNESSSALIHNRPPCGRTGFMAGKEKTDAKEHSTPLIPSGYIPIGYPNKRIAVGQGALAPRTLGLTFVFAVAEEHACGFMTSSNCDDME